MDVALEWSPLVGSVRVSVGLIIVFVLLACLAWSADNQQQTSREPLVAPNT